MRGVAKQELSRTSHTKSYHTGQSTQKYQPNQEAWFHLRLASSCSTSEEPAAAVRESGTNWCAKQPRRKLCSSRTELYECWRCWKREKSNARMFPSSMSLRQPFAANHIQVEGIKRSIEQQLLYSLNLCLSKRHVNFCLRASHLTLALLGVTSNNNVFSHLKFLCP